MSILEPRLAYRPFRYPQAFEFFLAAQQSHWIPTEVNMTSDVKDYNEVLTPGERQVVIRILRLFTQAEINIEEYWANRIVRWFPHPEIQQMAATFASFEALHIFAYDYLSQSLGLPLSEYEEFLKVPAMLNRQNRLDDVLQLDGSKRNIAKSLAIFSAMNEGVSLYASFCVLMNFARQGKLKGVRDIVSWSQKDEQSHSVAGIWLFRTLIDENPEIWDDDLKQTLYQAGRDTIDLEDAYIDYIFEGVTIEGLDPKDLKAFIRHRCNSKLQDLGLKTNWKSLDKEAVRRITDWYDVMSLGNNHKDFFSGRSATYAKGNVDWSKIWSPK